MWHSLNIERHYYQKPCIGSAKLCRQICTYGQWPHYQVPSSQGAISIDAVSAVAMHSDMRSPRIQRFRTSHTHSGSIWSIQSQWFLLCLNTEKQVFTLQCVKDFQSANRQNFPALGSELVTQVKLSIKIPWVTIIANLKDHSGWVLTSGAFCN